MVPQVPTARGIKVRSAADAHLLFYAVHLGRLPIIQRRLDAAERAEVTAGSVFIWEERSAASSSSAANTKLESDTAVCTDVQFQIPPSSDLGLAVPPNGVVSGIERWTDGLKWGPSRVRDDFLYYQEKDADGRDGALSPPPYLHGHGLYPRSASRANEKLIKQTYSVHYHPQVLENKPPVEPARKWHMTAYHSQATFDRLREVSSLPEVHNPPVPDGLFKKARVGKKRDGSAPATMPPYNGTASLGPSTSSPPPVQQPPSAHDHHHANAQVMGSSMSLGNGGSVDAFNHGGAMNGMGMHNGHGQPVSDTRVYNGIPQDNHHARQGSMGSWREGSVGGVGTPHMQHNMHSQPPPPQHPHQQHHPQHQRHHSHSHEYSAPMSATYPGPPMSHHPQNSGMYAATPSPYPSQSYGARPPPTLPYPPTRSLSYGDTPYAQNGHEQYPGYPGNVQPYGQYVGQPREVTYPGEQMRRHEDPNHRDSIPSAPNGAPPQQYDPFQAPSDNLGQGTPHMPPTSHPHSYQNGHGAQHYSNTPHVQHLPAEADPFHHTPQQSHAVPQPIVPPPPPHHRTYSQPSVASSTDATGVKTPTGVVRTRHSVPRKADGSTATPSPHQFAEPADARGRTAHFSPYSRPVNAPGPRQHPAFTPQMGMEAAGMPGAPIENNAYGQPRNGGHFVPAEHHPSGSPPQLPGAPQTSFPPGSQPSPFPVHQPPQAVTAAAESHRLGHSVHGSAPYSIAASGTSRGSASTGTGEPSPTAYGHIDYSIPDPFQQQPSYTFQNVSYHPHHPHQQHQHPPPKLAAIPSTSVPIGGGNTPPEPLTAPYTSYLPPHPNPHESPPFVFPVSTSFSSSGSGDSVLGTVDTPEMTAMQHHVAATTAVDPYSDRVPRGGPAPPPLDTSFTGTNPRPPSAAGTVNGSVNGSAASKLGPLTPSHHARDPEDQRVLGLLSRSTPTTAGGRGAAEGGGATSDDGHFREEE
ncbi:hypothetical protein CPB86DRAFT_817270 [Serendipita vermifera]|nr:hypothetical protein CPB86DRAFT_817270 [Serendipita vermifera]